MSFWFVRLYFNFCSDHCFCLWNIHYVQMIFDTFFHFPSQILLSRGKVEKHHGRDRIRYQFFQTAAAFEVSMPVWVFIVNTFTINTIMMFWWLWPSVYLMPLLHLISWTCPTLPILSLFFFLCYWVKQQTFSFFFFNFFLIYLNLNWNRAYLISKYLHDVNLLNL